MILKLNIKDTLDKLLIQEDVDGDKKITVEDQGPKKFLLESEENQVVVEGTYFLSNLLQELILAGENKKDFIDANLVFEKPSYRISRMIKDYFWDGLTRTIDEEGLEIVVTDSKSKADKNIIYVPYTDDFAYSYYNQIANKFNLEVIQLPKEITPEYVSSINDKGGILSLALVQEGDIVSGLPFVVPGGRFNEMYGWDSYFENIGLLIDGKYDLAKSMVDNFAYQIEHYGKILNANRSYYLTRTQPPFFSSMIREVFETMPVKDVNWLQSKIQIAIKEYETVWMVKGIRLTDNGLNRYYAQGIGLPPETEEGHYDELLKSFADDAGLSIKEYEKQYYQRKIVNKELDDYFVHDRSVRESGHDTSYRLEAVCASLNVVELNTMLYKYETDFEEIIKDYFGGNFIYNGFTYTPEYWKEKSQIRKQLMNQYLWNEKINCFDDYNIESKSSINFLSATSFFPLWTGIATKEQAEKMVKEALPKLICLGGIAGCSEDALQHVGEGMMQRQWDFPNGWPPHQIIIWKGLFKYGYDDLAQQLIYRWLWMITKNASDYNGTIPEKFDVVSASHKVFAEYGNQGTDFEYITREGFGWMNASYQYGLSVLKPSLRASLDELISPNILF